MLPERQLLLEGGQEVTLGGRALAILVALASRAGEVVSKDVLMAEVWPSTFVEDANLRVHVAGLRRALRDGQAGQRYIINIPGRGYSFVAPVKVTAAAAPPPAPIPAPPSSLPPAIAQVIGRSAVVETLALHLGQRRFVTIAGPGGIGKTTVALAIAQKLAASYQDGVYFVAFSTIASDRLVPSAIAAALGLAVQAEDAMPAVIAYTRHKAMLLVLDNCEHVIEAVALAAEQLSSSAAGVHVLSTSREPLRAVGERVYRLPPLEGPVPSKRLTAQEALKFPSIELLVERVAATLDGFTLSDADAPAAAEICQRLDGIALAIELAAGRVAAFGMQELAARLDDRFRLLTSGRRTALSRHQTLAAALDWSFALLASPEQRLLTRLAVFAGAFSLDAAIAVAPDAPGAEVVRLLGELVAKSLIAVEPRGGEVRYRLLDTTRLYGVEKLRATGALHAARATHAAHIASHIAPAEAACETLDSAAWLASYASQLGEVRAALDWAGGPDGNPQVFVALATAAIPIWVQLSLLAECQERVRRALALSDRDDRDAKHQRMRLQAARGWSLMYSARRNDEIRTAWGAALALADELQDSSYRLRAMWGMWMSRLNQGDLGAALGIAGQMLEFVEGSRDQMDLMVADRLMATTLHYRGDQAQARIHIDRMLARYAQVDRQPRVARFHVDQGITAHYFKARILWLQGFAEQASEVVETNIRESTTLGHALAFGSVLGQGACPVALFSGDFAAARRHAARLLEHAERHGLRLWHSWAAGFQGLLMIKDGDTEAGLQIMRATFEQVGDNRYLPRYMILLGEFAWASGQNGDPALGLATLDKILARCEASQERWYMPELLRMQGLLLATTGQAAAGEDCLLRALALAQNQGALAWHLRVASSLAELRRDRGAGDAELAAVFSRFTEGFATADLTTAARLLGRAI